MLLCSFFPFHGIVYEATERNGRDKDLSYILIDREGYLVLQLVAVLS